MNKLEHALEENNVTNVRNILKAYMTSDPSDSKGTIKIALQQTANNEMDIWEEHDGKEFSASPWTEEDFLDLQVDLRMNFSKERFMHMLDVGEKVYGSEKKAAPVKAVEPSSEITAPGGHNQSKKSQAMKWGIMAIGAGIVIILLVKMMNSNN